LIYSSTTTSLIFILINSLHAVKKPTTLLAFLLNIGSFATSVFDPMLGQKISTTTTPAPAASNA